MSTPPHPTSLSRCFLYHLATKSFTHQHLSLPLSLSFSISSPANNNPHPWNLTHSADRNDPQPQTLTHRAQPGDPQLWSLTHSAAVDTHLLLTLHEPNSCRTPNFRPEARILLWDLLTGKCTGSYTLLLPPPLPPPVGMTRITNLTVTPDGTRVCMALKGGGLLLLDVSVLLLRGCVPASASGVGIEFLGPPAGAVRCQSPWPVGAKVWPGNLYVWEESRLL